MTETYIKIKKTLFLQERGASKVEAEGIYFIENNSFVFSKLFPFLIKLIYEEGVGKKRRVSKKEILLYKDGNLFSKEEITEGVRNTPVLPTIVCDDDSHFARTLNSLSFSFRDDILLQQIVSERVLNLRGYCFIYPEFTPVEAPSYNFFRTEENIYTFLYANMRKYIEEISQNSFIEEFCFYINVFNVERQKFFLELSTLKSNFSIYNSIPSKCVEGEIEIPQTMRKIRAYALPNMIESINRSCWDKYNNCSALELKERNERYWAKRHTADDSWEIDEISRNLGVGVD